MERIRTYLKKGESAQLSASRMMESLLKLLHFDPSLYAVFEIWDRETRGLVRNCEASGIQGTRLIVSVPSVAHRQELLYMKDRLITRMNQALGKRMITDITFELAASAPQNPAREGVVSGQEHGRFSHYGKR